MIPETLLHSARPEGEFAAAPRPLRIARIEQDNYRIKTFTFEGTMPPARPGQFVMAWLPRLDEKPFSLAHNDPVTLTIAAVGPFSTALHKLRVGDRLWFRGPFGLPFRLMGERPALVGGGYGVAPLAWLAQWILAQGARPVAFTGGRTAADLIGARRFEALGVPLHATTEDGSAGEPGLVTTPVARMLESSEVDNICAVGPHGMLHALEALARRFGVPAQLSWEAYMGCAIGICGMCEHTDGSLLCVEGPVRLIDV